MFKMNATEIRELEEAVDRALFEEEKKKGGKTMCAIFPCNGVYVASGVVREFKRHGREQVDMLQYFREMKYGDFDDLRMTLCIKKC